MFSLLNFKKLKIKMDRINYKFSIHNLKNHMPIILVSISNNIYKCKMSFQIKVYELSLIKNTILVLYMDKSLS